MAERRTIVIDPVTRIEGHSKITLHLDEQGQVYDAQFHVTQFRGFEKFCEGRPFSEMPALMARIWRLVRNGMSLFVTDDTASVRYWPFQLANSFCQKDRTTSS